MLDRVAQFAGIRTDENLNEIDAPSMWYCRITPDYVPDPLSCLITGITPQKTRKEGLREGEFFRRINEQFSVPATCVCGYNNIRFDDEFIRNGFYRNFIDPYVREYANGNSRWDILDLLRTAHDLRPGGINWIKDSDNKPVFKLDQLTIANNISHQNAHDALADVRATIAMAKLVKNKQPRLFNFMLRLRKKEEVWKYLDIYSKNPVVHTSGMFTTEKGCTAIIAPVAVDPGNNNHIIAFDLRQNPQVLIDLSAEEIRKRVFTSQAALPEGKERILLKGIHVNRSPSLAPLSTLDKTLADKLGIDIELCLKHSKILSSSSAISKKIMDVYTEKNFSNHTDPDLQIYSGGFFTDKDRTVFESINAKSGSELVNSDFAFDDARCPEMLYRYIGRNYPADLKDPDKWKNFCAGRILFPPENLINNFQFFKRKIKEKSENKELAPQDKLILRQLQDYAQFLEEKILK